MPTPRSSTKKGKQASSPLSPEQQHASEQLLVLLKSFDLDSDILWNEDEDLFAENYKKGQTHVGFALENAGRELFYSSQGLKKIIENAVALYDSNHDTQWAKELGVNDSVSLFQSSEQDENGTNETIWVGHLEKGWMVCVEGFVGEYSDEDYDISASFEFLTGRTPQNLKQYVKNKSTEWAKARVEVWSKEVNQVLCSLPNAVTKEDLLVELEKQFMASDVFQSVGSRLQKNHLTEAVQEASPPQSTPRAPSRGHKL